VIERQPTLVLRHALRQNTPELASKALPYLFAVETQPVESLLGCLHARDLTPAQVETWAEFHHAAFQRIIETWSVLDLFHVTCSQISEFVEHTFGFHIDPDTITALLAARLNDSQTYILRRDFDRYVITCRSSRQLAHVIQDAQRESTVPFLADEFHSHRDLVHPVLGVPSSSDTAAGDYTMMADMSFVDVSAGDTTRTVEAMREWAEVQIAIPTVM
jgi:hypothetical protein